MAAQVPSQFARDYLTRVTQALDADITAVARKARLSPSTLTGFMKNNGRTKSIRASTLEAVARATGVPLPAEIAAEAPDLDAPADRKRNVPIYGLIGSNVANAYYWNRSVVDFATRLHGISAAIRAFALRMPDDSMDGWRRVNEFVYVDPMRAVAEGDHAFIELANENAPDSESIYVIRRVVQRRPSGVVLGSWGMNPAEERHDRKRILSFHRVLEWTELVA